jgi:diguanylate cyclase (GGDEF)-like protein
MTGNQGLSGYSDERYAAQRQAGFPWLRFAPDLEAEYRASYVELNALRIRAAAIVGILAVFGFIFVDHVLGSNLEPAAADWLLVLVTVPALLVPLVATFRPRAGPYVLHFLLGGVALTAISALVAIQLGRVANPWFPYEGLYLTVMFVYFVSGLPFYQALVCGSVLTAAYVVTSLGLRAHEKLLYESYLLLLANALGALGHYMLERQSRLGWLLRHELHQQAALDSLTGLLNRRSFTERLEMAWLQAQRALTSVGLLLIDLDHFKQVNEAGGHPFGDNALQHVARVLKGCGLRPLDAVGRYGGDELIAVWYEVDGTWLQKLAQDLPGRLEGLQGGDPGNPVKVTISGGAVLAWPRPGLSVKEAIKAADDVLFERKRTQRGTIGFRVLRQPGSDTIL